MARKIYYGSVVVDDFHLENQYTRDGYILAEPVERDGEKVIYLSDAQAKAICEKIGSSQYEIRFETDIPVKYASTRWGYRDRVVKNINDLR